MGRAASVAAAWLAAAVLSACGGGAGDGHGAHGGGGAAGHVGQPADAGDADRTIEVTALDAMAFDPPAIEVEAGGTVTFSVTNAGEAEHEFALGDAAMQAEHAEEMAGSGDETPHHGPNSVIVPPGRTAELTWRFGEAGTVEYACHVPGHYEAGMRGTITVV